MTKKLSVDSTCMKYSVIFFEKAHSCTGKAVKEVDKQEF